jgi:hypothetical protein
MVAPVESVPMKLPSMTTLSTGLLGPTVNAWFLVWLTTRHRRLARGDAERIGELRKRCGADFDLQHRVVADWQTVHAAAVLRVAVDRHGVCDVRQLAGQIDRMHADAGNHELNRVNGRRDLPGRAFARGCVHVGCGDCFPQRALTVVSHDVGGAVDRDGCRIRAAASQCCEQAGNE